MKKILFSILAIGLLGSVSFADCCKNYEKMPAKSDCQTKSTCGCEKEKTYCENYNSCQKKTTPECMQSGDKRFDKYIDDDEYCVYNQCYFDKQYRRMKKALCLTKQQENCIDNIYRSFKNDMEMTHSRYRTQKNKLLEMIDCDNDCWKEQRGVLKDIGRSTKQKLKDYDNDVKEQLCKNQKGDYRRFKRAEKKRMKRILKYGKIYKLPCSKCCN